MRKPSVDATALAKNGDKDTETVFCAYYVAVLKKRQVSSAFTGAAVSTVPKCQQRVPQDDPKNG